MSHFAYVAIDDMGKTLKGVVEADSPETAEQMLASRGLMPSSIKMKKAASGIAKGGLLESVTDKELILFTKQFKTMFQAGVSLVEILRIMGEQTDNKLLKRTVAQVGEDLKTGLSLHDALRRHPRVFPHLYCSMIKAGEASGALVEILERLTYLMAHESKIRSDIKSAMQYPMIVLVALCLAFFVLLTFVVPQFAGIFQNAKLTLPMPTQVCMALSEVINQYWLILLVTAGLAIIALRFWLGTPPGRYLRDLVLLRAPLVGPVFLKSAMSRFANIFAILQASGVSVLDAFDILSDTIGNAAVSREFARIKERLQQGHGISGPLRDARFFTPMVVNMVAIGEESGRLDEMLREVSRHYDDEVEHSVATMSQAIGPILMVGLAGVVGFFATAIFLPMWDLTQMVK